MREIVDGLVEHDVGGWGGQAVGEEGARLRVVHVLSQESKVRQPVRKVVDRIVEAWAQDKMSEGVGKVVDGVIESRAQDEMGEGWGEVVDGEIECTAEREVGEVGGIQGDGPVEHIPKLEVGEGLREGDWLVLGVEVAEDEVGEGWGEGGDGLVEAMSELQRLHCGPDGCWDDSWMAIVRMNVNSENEC